MISMSGILKTRRGGEPLTWTLRNIGPLFSPSYGVWHDGTNWAISGNPPGAGGSIATAVDPTGAWATQVVAGVFDYFWDIHYGSDGYWVACGNASIIGTALNPAGVWTLQDLTGSGGSGEYVYYDGVYWGNASGNGVNVSVNPTGGWVLRPTSLIGTTGPIIYGSDGYWVKSYNDPEPNIETALDPNGPWTTRVSNFVTSVIFGVEHGADGNWVAVGGDAGVSNISTTVDPTAAWTPRVSPFGTVQAYSIAYGAGAWVVGSLDGRIATAVDPTGVWTIRGNFPAIGRIAKVHYGTDGYWVAVGANGNILTARPGI